MPQPQAQPQQDAFNIYLSSDDPMSLEPGYTDHRQAEYRFYNGANGGVWNQAEMPAQIKVSNVGVFYFTVCDTTDELPNDATISITFDHSPFSAAKTAALANGSAMQYMGQRPVEGVSGSHKTWVATLNAPDFDTAAIGSGLSVEFTMVIDSTTKYYLDPKMIVRT
jgi:hypothetical protein